LAVALLHGVALTWGLPSSDAWDNDGVAPRDLIPGLLETFSPGKHYTYPPLELLIVTLLTSPVSLFAALRARSFAQPDIVASFLDRHVMTAFSIAARVLSFAYSIGIVIALGELAALLAKGSPERRSQARFFGMAIAGVDVALTYYAQTSNLDVPYLFWAVLALLMFARALDRDDPRGLRKAALFAACAIATKDQAYALFLLSLPTLTALWALRTTSPRSVLREGAIAAAIGIGAVLVLDGAPFNPTGFAARIRFLLGPASQDFAQYSKDVAGRAAAFSDSWSPFPEHYPWVFAGIFVAGFVLLLVRKAPEPRAKILAFLPLLAALSFTLTFNCWARRVEERFVMPQMLLVGVYGAVALAALFDALESRAVRIVAGVAVAAAFVVAARKSASVDAVMLRDPRYEAEAFLSARAKETDTIEVYGQNVYLPRFEPWMHVVRVGTEPVTRRNPMPGIVEKQDHFGGIAERNPRFIVVGEGYAWRYLIDSWTTTDGRVQPKTHRDKFGDQDGRDFFHRLFEGRAGYRTALHARYEGSVFPIVRMHGSLGAEVFVFERVD
jgi:hypothetical protein